MGGKDLRYCSALLALFVCNLLVLGTAAEPDFDDGIQLEDVQDEPVISATGANVEDLNYESPKYDYNQFHFVDHFDNIEESRKQWVTSQATKDDIAEEIAKYDGKWNWEPPQRIVWRNDIGLVLKSKAKHAAIAARLAKEFTFEEDKPLVVQYEVSMQEGQECGGSYIKLLSSGKQTEDLTKFNDKTPYTIMFGPDKCGNDIKMHFIFRHVNPINGSITEKHCKKPKDRLEEPFKDKLPHLYQLVVRPDNTFVVRIDHKIINEGSLLSAFTPPVNPPREIDDPADQKPKDWDEREKIPDPLAKKPDDWNDDAPPQIPDPSAVKPEGWLDNEPEMLADPTAAKPEDWDNDIDGDWEAPLVENPICEKAVGCGKWKAPLIANKEYKGKWRAPLIDNPNYQGKWTARKVVNPEYFEDLNPFKMTPISAIGIELWSMSSDILFDNLIITDDLNAAKNFAAKSFDIKRKFIDKESETFLNKVLTRANENPWVWKIAIVLIGTPLAYILYRTFSKRSSKEQSEATTNKKTDAVQPDDDATIDGAGDEIGVGITPITHFSKLKKSDLNVKENLATTPPAGDGIEPTAAGSGEEEAYDDNGEIETEESKTQPTTRKRRLRKDQS